MSTRVSHNGPTPERWARVKAIFLAAAPLSEAARRELLDAECAASGSLRAQVEAMLAADGAPGTIPATAAEILGIQPIERRGGGRSPSIPGYTIGRVIGRGTSGIVYEAEQVRPRRRVAVKVLHADMADGASRRRFEREAEVMARLNHPGIAALIGAGGDEQQPAYIAVEYIDGRSISEHARAGLDLREKVRLFVRVCGAMHYAHTRGVIHRDLKPANILVTSSGIPKIVDFGLARVADPHWHFGTASTDTEQVLGTLPYMSPEQVSGRGAECDTRSDVFGLGAVLFELIAGRPPFDFRGVQLAAAIRLRSDSPAPALRSAVRSVPRDLACIVAKAMAFERSRRYQSAAELEADLRHYLNAEPVGARGPGIAYLASRFARRHRSATLVFCLALLTCTGVLMQARLRERRAYESARDAAGVMLAELSRYLPQLGTRSLESAVLRGLHDPVQKYAEQHPDDPEIQRHYALLLEAESDIALDEGRAQEAQNLRERILGIHQRLAAGRDDSRVSTAMVKVGDVDKDMGRFELARQRYSDALGMDERLAASVPVDPEALANVCWGHIRLADLSVRSGETVEPWAHAERGLAALAELRKVEPGTARAWLVARYANAMAAKGHELEGDAASAAAYHAAAIDAAEHVIQADPTLREGIFSRSTELRSAAWALLREGRLEDAAPLIERSWALIDQSLRIEPNDTAAMEHRIGCLELHAEQARIGHREQDRREALEEALRLAERRVSIRPETVQCKRDLADQYIQLAAVWADGGEVAAARSATAKAIEIRRSLANAPEIRPLDLESLAHLLLEAPVADDRRPEEALAAAERAARALEYRGERVRGLLRTALIAAGRATGETDAQAQVDALRGESR